MKSRAQPWRFADALAEVESATVCRFDVRRGVAASQRNQSEAERHLSGDFLRHARGRGRHYFQHFQCSLGKGSSFVIGKYLKCIAGGKNVEIGSLGAIAAGFV